MTIDELKRLGMDDEIILVRGLKPILAKKAWYFKYHPAREEVERFKIHNMSEMMKPEDVEVHTMDVQAHLQARKNRAREILKEKNNEVEDIKIDIQDSKENNQMQNLKNNVKELDLQEELEKKFDELFGSNKKNNSVE